MHLESIPARGSAGRGEHLAVKIASTRQGLVGLWYSTSHASHTGQHTSLKLSCLSAGATINTALVAQVLSASAPSREVVS